MYAYLNGKDVAVSEVRPANKEFIVIDTLPKYPPDGRQYIWGIQNSKLVWKLVTPLTEPTPAPPTVEELQKETNLLKAQLKAQTESSTFLEDCIVEMALQVYK